MDTEEITQAQPGDSDANGRPFKSQTKLHPKIDDTRGGSFSMEQLRTMVALQEQDLERPTAARRLEALHAAGLDRIPMPGNGDTLQRWRALAAVARSDLSLAKLYEGHTDALAILHELGASEPALAVGTWGIWAAEAPGHRTVISDNMASGAVVLAGSKAWCSGAQVVSHALLTAWQEDGQGPQLVHLCMDQPSLVVSADDWQATAMAQSAGLTVTVNGATAQRVGAIGSYLQRSGFWHGGAGVAACWYGGATALAEALWREVRGNGTRNPNGFRLAALGKVDLALHACAALLREAAAAIDTAPLQDSSMLVLRVRQSAESCCRLVLDEVGRSLGAAPFCRDRQFARMATDLPVFIRQSHAERDFAALGEQLSKVDRTPWQL